MLKRRKSSRKCLYIPLFLFDLCRVNIGSNVYKTRVHILKFQIWFHKGIIYEKFAQKSLFQQNTIFIFSIIGDKKLALFLAKILSSPIPFLSHSC